MKNKIIYSILIIFSITQISCKKRGCTNPSSINFDENAEVNDGTCEYSSATVQLHLNHLFDNDPFYLDSTYQDEFGNDIQFTRATFYLGNPIYKDASGWTIDSSKFYTLISPEKTVNEFNTLNSGNVNDVDLLIGVDPITNHMDPAIYNSSNALSYQSPSMHWQMGTDPQSWSYLFIVLEGRVDIDGNGNIEPGESFVFHVGNDGLTSEVLGLTINSNISSGEIIPIDLNINWAGFLKNVDLSIDNFTHTMDNLPLATTIANNSAYVISN